MKENVKLGFYYALSAAASASALVGVKEAVACGTCTTSYYKDASTFLQDVANVTNVQLHNGFKSDTAPKVWVDATLPSGAPAVWLNAAICRQTADRVFINCASTVQLPVTPAVYQETLIPVTGPQGNVYGSGTSLWDHFRLQVACSGASCVNIGINKYLGIDRAVPINAACW